MGTGSPSRDLIMRVQRAPVREWAQHCTESAHRLRPYAGGRWGRTITPDDDDDEDDDELRAAAVTAPAAAALLFFTFLPPFAEAKSPVPHSSSLLTRFNAPGIDLGVRGIVVC